jgi:hypothetical protein
VGFASHSPVCRRNGRSHRDHTRKAAADTARDQSSNHVRRRGDTSFPVSNLFYHSVILLPSITGPQASTRTEPDESWFQTLLSAEGVNSASIFLFDHGVVADQNFAWLDLFDKAADLLDNLLQVIEVDEVKPTLIPISQRSR